MKTDDVNRMIERLTNLSVMRQRSEALVIALVGKDAAEKWWNSHNKAFDKTPHEQWFDDPHQVYEYLMNHGAGEYL